MFIAADNVSRVNASVLARFIFCFTQVNSRYTFVFRSLNLTVTNACNFRSCLALTTVTTTLSSVLTDVDTYVSNVCDTYDTF